MQKKYILIVVAVVIILLLAGGLFFFFSSNNTTTDPTLPTATPTVDPVFTATPTPDVPLISSICSTQWANQLDADQDTLPDSVETIYKTDSNNPDTDGDSYKDGEEVKNGYDPLKPGSARLDSDNDELTDDQECLWKTDAFKPDSDGDGYKDGVEIKNGYDPAKAGDGKGNDALPEKRAQLSDAALRPDVNSSNYTEGLSAIMLGNTPTNQIGQTRVTPEQVKQALANAKLNLTLPVTNISELAVTQTNTREDVAAYLAKIDSLKPAQLLDTNNLTTALTNAFYGNTQGIISVRSNLSNYERTLLAVPVPPSATQHMTLLVSTTRFLNTRLATIQEFGKSDPTKAYLAARELQEGLPQNITQVQNLRTALIALIK